MVNARTIARVIAVLALCAMVFAAFRMASRIAEFHRLHPREVFAFQRVTYPDFAFCERKVRLTDEDQDGTWYLRVTYGDESQRLLVTIPGNRKLPGLEPHADWMRVLMFASAVGKTIDQVHADLTAQPPRVRPRLAIVTRTPRPGEPVAYAGRLNPKAWVFDFYEFKPEGGFAHERLRFPTTGTMQADKEGELRENTWEYQAALSVIPEGIAPKPKFTNDGLKAAGWTLPATTLSMLTLIAAIAAASVLGRAAPLAVK